MGEVGRKHVYFSQPESFHLCMLIVDRTLLPFFRVLLWSGPQGSRGISQFDGEAGNIGIKGDASDLTPSACVASLYSASAQAGHSGSTNHVEECMGQYPGILRGRILARLRIRRTKRLNKTRRPKLRILMLDSTGLACASRACKGCNGLSGGFPCRSPYCLLASSQDCILTFGGMFSMFVLVPGDNLVDSWYQSRSLGLVYCNLPPEVRHNQCWDNLALCSHGIRRIMGMLSQNLKVERNPEAGWTIVKESVGCVNLQGDLLVYPFDSKSSSPGRLLLILRLFGAVSSFAFSSYPLGRHKDGTICVRLVNPEQGSRGTSQFDGEAGNIGIKGDASDHTQSACAASLYSASAQAGLSGSTNHVEECMGQYPGILRGRILARLRIRRTKRLNKTRRPKLRILMLDYTGLACASRACKGCNGLSGGFPCRSPYCLLASSQDCSLTFGGMFSMFVLVPGDNLVDSWYQSRSLGLVYCNLPPEVSHNQCWDNLALCSHGIRRILGMLSQNLKVERYILMKPIGSGTNVEAGWTVVKESVGCVNLQGDLLLYPFDSEVVFAGYPLGRYKDGTICVRLVNPEYRYASHSTFRR
ncbi:LOW QUALITY PROTEIN: hypothetical protein HID58_022584 [Brassica napus]|uniref:CST complex subunit CTC1 n=1 Tax=Brassica napus TaxID=3708 RepID=A0ABQ8D294_BRANA|nr:LOW QUALITY PROTEIN: hypothetical protein HID58_022584 [Brassica napus]